MKILHITSILPSEVQHKKDENDILLKIAQSHQQYYPEDEHVFLLVLPYSNVLLAGFRKRWKQYYQLIKKGSYKIEGFTVTVVGMPGFYKDDAVKKTLIRLGWWRFKKRITGLLSEVNPDMLHAHNLKGNTELADILASKYHIPYVASLRSPGMRNINRIRKNDLKVSALLSVNQYMLREYCRDIPVKCHFIPHPVEVPQIPHPKKESSVPAFVSAGRLLSLKNFDTVARALSRLNEDFLWDVFGDGPEMQNLQLLCQELEISKNVRFFGRVANDQLLQRLGEYDLFLMPSYPETLGRVYFEAMANAVPVLAAKNTGVDGIITDQKHGYLVDHENEEMVHQKISSHIQLPEKEKNQMRQSARELMKQFSMLNILKKYKYLYSSLLSEQDKEEHS